VQGGNRTVTALLLAPLEPHLRASMAVSVTPGELMSQILPLPLFPPYFFEHHVSYVNDLLSIVDKLVIVLCRVQQW
jgi:hypothetical protein